MYKIEKKKAGYLIQISGDFSTDDAYSWYNEFTQILEKEEIALWLIVDLRGLNPVSEEVQKLIMKGQMEYKKRHHGERSAVISDNPVALTQMINAAIKTGVAGSERKFIDATKIVNPTQKAIEWVKNGKEPI